MRNLLVVTGVLLALAPTAAWSFEGGRANSSSPNYWLAEPPRNLAPEEEIQSPAEMREAPAAKAPVASPVAPPLSPPPITEVPNLQAAHPNPEAIPSLASPPALESGASDKTASDLQLIPTNGEADGSGGPQLPPMP